MASCTWTTASPSKSFSYGSSGVPRVPLLDTARSLGDLEDGIEVWLAGVSLDNHVTVTLEGRGTGAEAALETYRNHYVRWEATAQTHPDLPSPEWPAERPVRVIPTLSDDVDTEYHIDAGENRGPEWVHVWQYRPTPPTEATTLRLAVQLGGHPTTIDLPLPRNT